MILTLATNEADNQAKLDECNKFAVTNRMLFGHEKCKTIVENDFETQQPAIGDQQIEFASNYNYLGIKLEVNDCNFRQHANEVLLTTKRKLGKVNHFISSQFAPSPFIKFGILYKQIVRPNMEYGQQVINYSPAIVAKFEAIQTNALKKALHAPADVLPSALRLLTRTSRLQFRWAALKEVFIKKTLTKPDCLEKRKLEESLLKPKSRINKIINDLNIDLSNIEADSCKNIKDKWRKTSFYSDLAASKKLPILRYLKPGFKCPFWLKENPGKRTRRRSKLVAVICAERPDIWNRLFNLLQDSSHGTDQRRAINVASRWKKFLAKLADINSPKLTTLIPRLASTPTDINDPASASFFSALSVFLLEGDPRHPERSFHALDELMRLLVVLCNSS